MAILNKHKFSSPLKPNVVSSCTFQICLSLYILHDGQTNLDAVEWSSKEHAYSLNKDIDACKSLHEAKMLVINKHSTWFVQMHYSWESNFQMQLHKLDAQAKELAKDLKLQLSLTKVEVN